MKVYIVIRKSTKQADTESKANLYVRVRDGRVADVATKTNLFLNPYFWDIAHEQIKSKVICDADLREYVNKEVRSIKQYVENEWLKNRPERLSKEWLDEQMDRYYNPQKYKKEDEISSPVKLVPLVGLFDEFLEKHQISEVRKKNFRVLGRSLRRYELFVCKTRRGMKDFVLYAEDTTADTLRDFWKFLENEHVYYKIYPQLFKQIPEKRMPSERGKNALLDTFTRLRTFFLWLYNNHRIKNRPFDEFPIQESTYGTPYYISIEERDKIYHTNLSRHPKLAVQRDIFVFQCLVGCRVGDLMKFRKDNIIDDYLEYVPNKTKEGRAKTVRVPLNAISKEIVERYQNWSADSDKLLPFISEQQYNKAIKLIFMAAGLKRLVTVMNPRTGQEEKRVLFEIASSHIARRTFIGNLYKQVKDPNLVGILSGHKEGSKAFTRYRDIDDDMRNDLVNLLLK